MGFHVSPKPGAWRSVATSRASTTIAIGHRDGTARRWSAVTMPQPIPGAGARQNAVSCVSSSSCFAVGLVLEGRAPVSTNAHAQAWNGTSWTIQAAIANPSGGTNSTLRGVSCASTSWCMSVGSYTESGGATASLAEMRTGTRWGIVATPRPVGATASGLNGIACTSANACVAVGWYRNSSSTFGMELRWDGFSWTIQHLSTTTSVLKGVSCGATTSCVAVGHSGTSPAGAVAERWNGTSWFVEPVIANPGTSSGVLQGAGCVAANRCATVGSYRDAESVMVTLAEHLFGL